MTIIFEDAVRDRARETLGLGSFDDTPDRADSDTGQITTFNQLGFKGVSDKPDGWYLPHNKANPALILETKSSDKDLNKQAYVDELLKNLDIVVDKYDKVVGILTNGIDIRVFLRRKGGTAKEAKGNLSPKLQPKEYYLGLFTDDKIDQGRIFSLTKKINDSLHFDFGIKNLNHRMIFTACALVAKRFGANFLAGMDYAQFHNTIYNTLTKNSIRSINQAGKLDTLVEVFSEIKMNLNVNSDDEKTSERVKNLIGEFLGWVEEISDALSSDAWRGEDVMSIFFNEFSRYKAKSESGQIFTPDHITGFMYKLISVSHRDFILDATCGSGAFLVKAMSNMIDEVGGSRAAEVDGIRKQQLFGIEFDREIYALACANMLIHKDGRSNLILDDARQASAVEWMTSVGATKVLMNPPYENKYGCMKIVENVLNSATPGARAAFILPDKKLEKSSKAQMKRILNKHRLTQAIKLPENLFFGVGVTTSIFVFDVGTPQNGEEFFSCFIEDDGLKTVKNQGRQDVHGKWPGIEAEWLKIIKRGTGHESVQWNDPEKCLSWQEPRVPFSITDEDFVKIALDYQAFVQGIDIAKLREHIADSVLYRSKVEQNGGSNELSISVDMDFESVKSNPADHVPGTADVLVESDK